MTERKRVLIVDDEGEIRSILHDFLGTRYSCETLDCAKRALALLARERFDVVITDIGMPGMTGLEMIPHINQLAPDTVIVMISGQRMIESAVAAMRAGAFDYIIKPFELTQVNDVVQRALAHSRQRRKVRAHDHSLEDKTRVLQDALDNKQFVVYYQPQVSIDSRQVVGAEALVRWQHPQRGLISPSEFISWAEETGQIVPLGEMVLRQACEQAQRWQHEGRSDFSVAVNVSPRQLREKNFPETIKAVLNATQVKPESLEIEITETSLMENTEAGIRTLKCLRDLGVRSAIDDFGTGYSSLGYLKRLPIDSVKLDASFVKDATTDPDDAALVMAIITLAHNLRLKVIAEGIEREDQFAFLRLLRCDEGQGYLFGEPGPSNLIPHWPATFNHRLEQRSAVA